MEERKRRLINSEAKVEDDNFKIIIGTVDKKNPVVDYIEISGYMLPETDTCIHADVLTTLEKVIKAEFGYTINNKRDVFDGPYMFLFDVADKRVKVGKKSYFTIQIYFKLTKDAAQETELSFKNVVSTMSDIFNANFKELPTWFSNMGYSVSKTK